MEPSEHWGDPRAKLLQPEQWEGIRSQICQTLGREVSAERTLESLEQQLEQAYQRTAANVPTNAALLIEQRDEGDVPNLERLKRLQEPESLLVNWAKLLRNFGKTQEISAKPKNRSVKYPTAKAGGLLQRLLPVGSFRAEGC